MITTDPTAPQEPAANRRPDGTFGPRNRANPGGRPKGSVSLASRLHAALAERPEEAEAIVKAAIDGARAGDPAMLRIVLDRHDGPLAVKIEGLGEAEFVERLVALGQVLVARIPREYHDVIADAIRAGMAGPQQVESGG